MAQAVKVDRRQVGGPDEVVEPAGEHIRVHGCAVCRGKDLSGVLPDVQRTHLLFQLPVPIGLQQFHRCGRHPDHPAGRAVLCLVLEGAPVRQVQGGAPNGDNVFGEVHVLR